MRSGESQFIESLNDIPVEDIIRVVEEGCRRLESNLLKRGSPLDDQAASILIFRRFINAVMLGVRLTHCVLPTEHTAIYRKLVASLVKAGRLPQGANEEFDKTFSAVKGSKRAKTAGRSRA